MRQPVRTPAWNIAREHNLTMRRPCYCYSCPHHDASVVTAACQNFTISLHMKVVTCDSWDVTAMIFGGRLLVCFTYGTEVAVPFD